MGDRTSDEAVLVTRARGGCGESAAHLVQIYREPIVDYLARLLARGGGARARCDAEDVAQETFIRMLRGLERLKPGVPFSAWIFTIAKRTGLNHLRTERRHSRRVAAWTSAAETASRNGPLESALVAEARDRLWGIASRTLPKRQFTALWLRYVEEMPVAGIARTLGSTAAAVKLQLLRGRRRLEPALAEVASSPHAGKIPSTKKRMAVAGVSTAAGACLVAFWLAVSQTPLPPPHATEPFAIETFPLPDEIGELILVETAALAAEAVGLPRWE